MTTELAAPIAAEIVEKVLVQGDLSKLDSAERLVYYRSVCESVGLNPLTKPFEYITLNGKLRLYAVKGATDQLRSIHGISIERLETMFQGDLVVVIATAKDKTGRIDSDTGAVAIEGLKGEAKANAIMKAITKAKRRVTLSMTGLGMLDETEVEPIPGARVEVQRARAVIEPEVVDDGQFPPEGEGPLFDKITASQVKAITAAMKPLKLDAAQAKALVESILDHEIDGILNLSHGDGELLAEITTDQYAEALDAMRVPA